MDRITRFNRAIHYIEEHLTGKIALERAAQAGFTSIMQLYRDFYTFTGHSVKEYIRKRRLSNALNLIRCSDISLVDIAYGCGYSSQQALCRSVRSAVFMTPLEYRHSRAFYYFPRFDGASSRQVTVASENLPKTIRAKFYHPQLRGIEDHAVRSLSLLLPAYRGRIFGRNGPQRGNRFCYEVSVEYAPDLLGTFRNSVFCDAAVHPETGLVCARTAVRNDEEEIGQAWNDLYDGWLKTSMFEPDAEGYYEEYLRQDGQVKRLVLYLPVKKREDYDRITLTRSEERTFLVATRKGEDAEQEASHAVMNVLASHKPEAIRAVREFYVSKTADSSTCGVRLDPAAVPSANSGLEVLRLPEGSYAVLESGCCGDGQVLESRLDRWVRENGLRKSVQPACSIYVVDGGYGPEHVKTTCWIRLEDVKNG
ncbi:helix-turn-helix domain-containing protein [Gorillibacterium sp. sgz5001074]|uniref:helix-turn-helix domain-containing protein n=1 Tax=Gorillibacterium sp. sgz5001074 TaxID=3446695 RepID=UPI003F66AF40